MKARRLLAWLLLGIFCLPILEACGAPNSGATDVISPQEVKAHKIAKEKHEGGQR